MGLRHLEDTEDLLRLNRYKEFSRTEIRDKLNHNWDTVEENLEYLVKEGKVNRIEYCDGLRFKWLK